MEKFWKDAVLENIPHGQDGELDLLTVDEMTTLVKLLVNKGYAVCVTGGGIGKTYYVHWLYAGDTDELDFANYDKVAFTSTDYIDDYPQAYYESYTAEDDVPDYPCDEDDD